MATVGTFNAWTNIFYNVLGKLKTLILFEYSMLLNSKIEKGIFFPIYSGNINKFYQDEKLSYLYIVSK